MAFFAIEPIQKGRQWIGRGFLACLSCLLSLLMLELGSSALRTWIHRLPALPRTFEAAPSDEYRIVILGGSSALGEPYRPWLSVGQIVAWQLQQAVPSRRFECEILAWLGDSLEMQHRKLATLKRRPDAVIIYSGHNEFAAVRRGARPLARRGAPDPGVPIRLSSDPDFAILPPGLRDHQ